MGVLTAGEGGGGAGHTGPSPALPVDRLYFFPPTKQIPLRRGYTLQSCHEHPPFSDKQGTGGENGPTPEEGRNNDGPSEGLLLHSSYSIKA